MENDPNTKIDSHIGRTKKQQTYWLTRFFILRLLGIIYAVAFLVAINQLIPLIGSDGLLPAGIFLSQVKDALGSVTAGFLRLPSIFWFSHTDNTLLIVSWIGFILSLIVAAGYANAIVLAVLWFLYMSIVHVGQDWYGYGWEIQLIETGFLAIFLCPLLDMRPFPRRPPPFPIIVLFRWLNFRIMLGSGLIKIRGDEIWRNGTALYHHFETQPIPGPLSRWFNFLPHRILKIGVWFNFLAELLAPLFVFWPRIARHIAGVIIVLFQLSIILSGNLSFLNWLTIIPALACFDDGFWMKIGPKVLAKKVDFASQNAIVSKPMIATVWVITGIVVLLSIQPALNLLSSKQVMNTSFDPFELVNTYGAFGTVGQERANVIFEGTMDAVVTDTSKWTPYIYKGLPVALDKRPPQIAPYQLHLDWQMWFASMGSPDEYTWTFNLVWKLLHNDPNVTCLFANNPFTEKPPQFIRAILYNYTFAQPNNSKGFWWNRKRIGLWLPPLSVKDSSLSIYVKGMGWTK